MKTEWIHKHNLSASSARCRSFIIHFYTHEWMITLPIGQPTLLFSSPSGWELCRECELCVQTFISAPSEKRREMMIAFCECESKTVPSWYGDDEKRKKGERQQRFSLVVIVKCHKHLWSRFFPPSNPSIIFHEKKVHMFWKPGKKRKLVIDDADDARNGEDWRSRKKGFHKPEHCVCSDF